jgi:hypothetical protein
MGRRSSQGNSTPQKTYNSTEDLVGNEEKNIQFLTPNRTIINMTN